MEIKKIEVDCSTNEQIEVTEIIPDEQWEEMQSAIAEQQAAAEAAAEALAALKASARTKLVAGQPLTEEEAATLVI